MNNRWIPADQRYQDDLGQHDPYRHETGWREYDDVADGHHRSDHQVDHFVEGNPEPQGVDRHYGTAENDFYDHDAFDYAFESDADRRRRSPEYREPQPSAAEQRPYAEQAHVNNQHSPRPAPTRVGSRRQERKATARKRRGRAVLALALVFVVLIGGALAFAAKKYFDKPEVAANYAAGAAGPDTVVHVAPGDTSDQIASEMASKDVTKSASAFFEAAVQNTAMNGVQPGYYQVPTKIPGEQAVAALVDPTARVGQVVLSEGRQLHDSSDVKTGSTKEGIYRKISAASCLGTGSDKKCVSYDDLNKAGASSDLAALGVPDWAQKAVKKVPDRDRQLEGLIASGAWDFDPTASPTDILKQLVGESTESYASTGITQPAKAGNLDPYQKLIAASLVERESLPQDFGKVARVIINRLAVDQPLQFDSTVNYALDTTELATTDADRAKVTPWNTYASPGLPATPISSPSIDALKAIEAPAPGNWLYFVTVDAKGTTLFTDNYDEHLRNIEKAQSSGILDSGR